MSSPADPPVTTWPSGTDGRLPSLDALRSLALGLLIMYHVGMYYVTWDWHLKSPFASTALELRISVIVTAHFGIVTAVAGSMAGGLLGSGLRADHCRWGVSC
jgi:uncharacterized membrane protein